MKHLKNSGHKSNLSMFLTLICYIAKLLIPKENELHER